MLRIAQRRDLAKCRVKCIGIRVATRLASFGNLNTGSAHRYIVPAIDHKQFGAELRIGHGSIRSRSTHRPGQKIEPCAVNDNQSGSRLRLFLRCGEPDWQQDCCVIQGIGDTGGEGGGIRASGWPNGDNRHWGAIMCVGKNLGAVVLVKCDTINAGSEAARQKQATREENAHALQRTLPISIRSHTR